MPNFVFYHDTWITHNLPPIHSSFGTSSASIAMCWCFVGEPLPRSHIIGHEGYTLRVEVAVCRQMGQPFDFATQVLHRARCPHGAEA